MKNLAALLRDVEKIDASMKLHAGLLEEVGKLQGEHAEAIAALAEGKKPAGPGPGLGD